MNERETPSAVDFNTDGTIFSGVEGEGGRCAAFWRDFNGRALAICKIFKLLIFRGV